MAFIEGKSLVDGFKILVAILAVAIALYVLLPIGGLTIGTITNTATSGAVNVSSAMNTAMTGYETSYIADTDSIISNTTVIIGLVAIVVIITVFGLQKLMSNIGKSGGVN